MKTSIHARARALAVLLAALALFAPTLNVLAQTGTRIKLHSNKYKISDDVRAGREAAAQVERQMPIMRDEMVESYVERVGQRLGAAIPQEFQHPEFRYTFRVVNARDINAFALPGGPMFVNVGSITAAANEAELAGVMAHEMAHVYM
jgi:beta-barrel assembly-enhancing protease